MFCPNCGAQVSDNVSYCTHCGAPQQAPVGESLGTRDPRTRTMPAFAEVLLRRTVMTWNLYSLEVCVDGVVVASVSSFGRGHFRCPAGVHKVVLSAPLYTSNPFEVTFRPGINHMEIYQHLPYGFRIRPCTPFVCGNALQTQAPPVYAAPIVAPKARPALVTVIAVLLIVGGAIGLISAFIQPGVFVLGLAWVHGPVAILYSLILAGVSLGCGLGFLRQRALARQVFIGWTAFSLLSSLLSLTSVDRALYLTSHGLDGSSMEIARIVAYVTIVVMLAVWVLMLSYVAKHKDYFPN